MALKINSASGSITLTAEDGSGNADVTIPRDGIVSDLSDLSITATASEINTLDGITATVTELNYVGGVTSNIQTQLDAKGTASTLTDLGLTATSQELNYVDGVTSAIQTQLDSKPGFATITVTVSGGKFYLDGTQQQKARLTPSVTYRFDQSDSSNSSHPLKISATSDGTHNSGTEYTTGVTLVGTPGSAGAYTEVTFEQDTPYDLFYYCANHANMGGGVEVGAIDDLADLGVDATAAELNILDGATLTTTELNYVDGVTSAIQTQLDAKGTVSTLSDLSITATASEINTLDGVTATTAELNLLDGVTATTAELNLLDGVTASTTELNYVDGVTSAIQTQIDAKLATSLKGAANGLAELDSSGLVPTSQLPSYVDDVLEYTNASSFPGTGETGKIYVALDTNDIYRWSGSAYVKVSDAVSTADQATALATARTISLTGDVSGSTSFDGTANVSITATIADDSHNHVISNVDGLQAALDAKQASGTYNTIIGTDSDIDTSGSTIIDNIYVTDGVITSMGTRTLTLADLGYTGATNANYITNNNQLTNGAGYTTFTANQSLNTSSAPTFAGVTINGQLDVEEIAELVTTSTSTTGAITFDTQAQGIIYFSSNQTANRSVNFTNVSSQLSNGQSITCTMLMTQGSTAYYISAVSVDSSVKTVKYQGGSAPTGGNANSVDVYTYTILKDSGGSIHVFGAQTQYA